MGRMARPQAPSGKPRIFTSQVLNRHTNMFMEPAMSPISPYFIRFYPLRPSTATAFPIVQSSLRVVKPEVRRPSVMPVQAASVNFCRALQHLSFMDSVGFVQAFHRACVPQRGVSLLLAIEAYEKDS